jgi:parallel beta-helix repeat protein
MFLILGLISFWPLQVSAADFYVIATRARSPKVINVNCDEGGFLQDAIDAAQPHATILVDGTCNENVIIDESKWGLTIDGQVFAIIAADAGSGPAVSIRGRDITIRNFGGLSAGEGAIIGGGRGIVVSRSASATIRKNVIEKAAGAGITVEAESFATILGNTINDNGGNGIGISEGSAALIGDDCKFANLNGIVNNGLSGIAIGHNSEATVRGAIIQGNGTNGIFITDNSMADTASNTISANGGDGIDVRRGSSVRMGRRDTPVSSCADDPNKTFTNNVGFGIQCDSLSTVDGELGTLTGTAGATSLNDTNADCPNCCFAELD